MNKEIMLSCEHAGKLVPVKYKIYFKNRKWLLSTHRGSDPGAFDIARILSKRLNKPLHYCKWTRLLVDVNRTMEQPTLFSALTERMPEPEKAKVLKDIYLPYHEQLVLHADKLLKKNRVVHISVHSFTPKMKNEIRDCDIGLLYKKSDKIAHETASRLQAYVKAVSPNTRVRLNYPYNAEEGGIMEAIRAKIKNTKNYSGIYIEINQRLSKTKPQKTAELITEALQAVL